MPMFSTDSGCDIFYQIDDFTDPWNPAETVVLLHGNAESGEAWRSWIPHLGRHLRIIRPDLRGFGRSTATLEGFPWTLKVLGDDLIKLTQHLKIQSFHLVAAKIGGTIALNFAAEHPELVKTLTVLGAPPSPKNSLAPTVALWVEQLKKEGLEPWARESMRGRLGSRAPEKMLEYWTQLMAKTALSTQLGFMKMVPTLDVRPGLSKIQCPTLVITTTGSGLGSVQDTESWCKLIKHATMLVLDDDSYHVAAVKAEEAALATLDFIQKHSS